MSSFCGLPDAVKALEILRDTPETKKVSNLTNWVKIAIKNKKEKIFSSFFIKHNGQQKQQTMPNKLLVTDVTSHEMENKDKFLYYSYVKNPN